MTLSTAVLAPPTLSTRAAAEKIDVREFLSFELGQETYGLALRQVQEVRSFEQPTRIAHAEAWVLGVIDLRGLIVPVADLRTRMGLTPSFDGRTVTVVVNVGRQTFGLVVDAVSDVVMVDRLRPLPSGSAIDSGCIDGLSAIRNESGDERLLIALNADELLRGFVRADRATACH
jgi:purine-binding chemotaxis protein CheW